jgi:hypothetical protein
MRTAVLVVALVAIAGLAALTVNAVISGGFDVLAALSVLIIALFAFGIVGALLHPPDDP